MEVLDAPSAEAGFLFGGKKPAEGLRIEFTKRVMAETGDDVFLGEELIAGQSGWLQRWRGDMLLPTRKVLAEGESIIGG